MRVTALPKRVPPPAGRLGFLDTLRGLAAVYVVVYHMTLLSRPVLEPPDWLHQFVHAGGAGVTLFFVVSAFSLCYTMPFRFAKARPLTSFYVHRFFRIAPLFYAAIVCYLIRDVIMFGVHHEPTEVLASLLFVFNVIPGWEQGFVWASWTIGVEMLFYAIFPLIYARTKNIYDSIAWLIGSLLVWELVKYGLASSQIPAAERAAVVQWSVFRHLPVFAAGVLAFHLLEGKLDPAQDSPTRRARGRAMLAGGVFLFMALLNGWLPNLFGVPYYWQAVVAVLLVIGLCFAPIGLVVNRVTARLGKLSYSIYLVHPTVVYLLNPVYQWLYAHVSTRSLAFGCCFALSLAVVVAMSELTFRFIEKPGITLGRHVERRWLSRPWASRTLGAEDRAGSEDRSRAPSRMRRSRQGDTLA
ncbi:acyltransferase family protein [Aeromicrobium wangtongii]|uniref:acyltransferase family protein n=1 Tax=Aeromicrobium wangtongii TaxID=2969247 RepID=UPI002017405D|nr:acyltransferase [Aeromicrobium wangtongii]MCL3816998.1 acyltransferase [Aeromicrobium wangtongii]